MRQFMLLLLLSGVTACFTPRFDLLSHPLEGGGTIRELTEGADYAVVVVMDPAQSFACASNLSRWMAWARYNPGRYHLVFTRPVTTDERRKLLFHRIRPNASLTPSGSLAALHTPREYLVSAGRVVRGDTFAPGTVETPLLAAAEQGRVAGMLDHSEQFSSRSGRESRATPTFTENR